MPLANAVLKTDVIHCVDHPTTTMTAMSCFFGDSNARVIIDGQIK